ncbi:hypothetical protein HPP92_007184 [Vanilla planifolia]|uniref:Reverse transcriptase domain-containing protein n=1 Tax=Vanilla planifolia TaxID=51239 RepID=A0A835RLF1_VANPL|nr:hypothetical protein HPP92_007184 [Vanilla planifolia]
MMVSIPYRIKLSLASPIFAGDTRILTNGTKQSLKNLMKFLNRYEKASGQRMNRDKSCFVSGKHVAPSRNPYSSPEGGKIGELLPRSFPRLYIVIAIELELGVLAEVGWVNLAGPKPWPTLLDICESLSNCVKVGHSDFLRESWSSLPAFFFQKVPEVDSKAKKFRSTSPKIPISQAKDKGNYGKTTRGRGPLFISSPKGVLFNSSRGASRGVEKLVRGHRDKSSFLLQVLRQPLPSPNDCRPPDPLVCYIHPSPQAQL